VKCLVEGSSTSSDARPSGGEWMRTKWRRRRGFLKIHIAVDVRTKQGVAMEVTDERTGDGKVLVPLVEQGIYLGRGDAILEALRSIFKEYGIEPFAEKKIIE